MKLYEIKVVLILLDVMKFCEMLLRLIKYCKISFITLKDQNILLNFAKLSPNILLNMSWLVGKGPFEHKWTLDFILLTLVHAKWSKFKPTFAHTFNKVWRKITKVFQLKLLVLIKFCTILSRSWPKSIDLHEYHSYLSLICLALFQQATCSLSKFYS